MKVHVFSFESDIVSHCNNHCVGCNHWAPLRAPEYYDPQEFARDLGRLAEIATADKFGVLGGEPTLHPQLAQILRAIRLSGIAPLIEMWTNGQRLERMPDEVWQNVDSIVVNRYPGKLTDEHVAALTDKALEMRVAFEVDTPDQFYKNHLGKARTNAAEYFAVCPYSDHCFTIRHGCLFRCPQSSAIPGLLLGLPVNTDGIALDGLTAEGLQAFLTAREPLESCSVCSRYDKYVGWHEQPDKAKWLDESLG